MTEIIPAILTDSPLKFKELVRRLEPYARRVHFDIADGDFVPNKTVKGYEEIKDVEAALKFDVHLMVRRPEEHIKEWLHTQADRFLIHVESETDTEKLFEELHKNKRKVGLVIKPETDINKLEQNLKNIDFVQFMTVNPGFQGAPFVEEVVDKIASFHAKYPDIIIMCDGGVTPETAPKLIKAGASELVSGSYIIKSQDVAKAIKELELSCTI